MNRRIVWNTKFFNALELTGMVYKTLQDRNDIVQLRVLQNFVQRLTYNVVVSRGNLVPEI